MTYTSHSLGTPLGHKTVGARDVGRFLQCQLLDGTLVVIEATPAMVGWTVEEVIAQVGPKRPKRTYGFSPRSARFAKGLSQDKRSMLHSKIRCMLRVSHLKRSGYFSSDPKRVRPRDERPSFESVMRFITDASPQELDALLSKVISKPISQTAVARAAAAIDPAIDVPEGDGEADPAVVSAAGKMLTSQQVADRLKKTRQGVNEMLKRGAILGIRYGTHWRFPSAQFDRTAPVAGLTPLLRTLAHLDPWDALSVILAPEADLAQRPLELLKQGERAKAIAVASRKAADLRSLSGADRVMSALSADMAAEEEADRAAGSFAGRSVSQADV